jgi:hypothetical protein
VHLRTVLDGAPLWLREFGTAKPIPGSSLGTAGIPGGLRPVLVSDRHAVEPCKRDQKPPAGNGVDRRMRVRTPRRSTPELLLGSRSRSRSGTGVSIGVRRRAVDAPGSGAAQTHLHHVQSEIVAVA